MKRLPKQYQRRLRVDLAPTIHPTLGDIRQAAGFYEGEGCCSNSHGTTSYVSITQKDPWVLYKMRNLFGGSVKRRKPTGFGFGNKNTYWWWILSGVRARGFLMTIYSLLSPRRKKQLEKGLSY